MSQLPMTLRNKANLERNTIEFASVQDLTDSYLKFNFKLGDIIKIRNSDKVEYRVLSSTSKDGVAQVVSEFVTYYWNLVDLTVKRIVDTETKLSTARDYSVGDVVLCLGRTTMGDGYHTIRIKAANSGTGAIPSVDSKFWNIVDDKALTERLSQMKATLDAAIALKIDKASIVSEFGTGGVDKVPSAELFNALYQIVQNLQGGSSLKNKLTVERMLGIDSGVKTLNKGSKTIVSDKGFFFAPKLYIEGQFIHSSLYTLDAVGGVINLTDAYSLVEDVPYQIFDEYPRDIKFAIDTVLLLTGSALKDELVADDVVKILGDSAKYDGGQHLRIVETTSKLNGVSIGRGLYLNEVPNTRLKTVAEKADFNRRDLLNIAGGLGANGGGREYTFIQDAGTKTVGKMYLDRNTLGLYRCVRETSTTDNNSDFERVDLNGLSDKLQNLIEINGFGQILKSKEIQIKIDEGLASKTSTRINFKTPFKNNCFIVLIIDTGGVFTQQRITSRAEIDKNGFNIISSMDGDAFMYFALGY